MTTMGELYDTRRLEPAQSEAEWQERRNELPPAATLYAGDGYSQRVIVALREVILAGGRRERRYALVDEHGRYWLDKRTEKPANPGTPRELLRTSPDWGELRAREWARECA